MWKTSLILLIAFFSFKLTGQTFGTGIYDIDGNYYQTVVLNNEFTQPKEWMVTNLRVTKYSDGTSIPNEINSDFEPGWRYYANSSSNNDIYGKLYSGGTLVTSKNVCPNGWRVATKSDWEELMFIFGNQYNAGGPLKSLDLWDSPNTGATNSSNFSATPGGFLNTTGNGIFQGEGTVGVWWAAWEIGDFQSPNFWRMHYNNTEVDEVNSLGQVRAASIRCVNNNPPADIIELNNSSKNLIQILDMMGRETTFKPNTPLIYVYDDGSTEKVFSVEY